MRRVGILLLAGLLLFGVMVGVGELLTHVLVHGPVGRLDDSIERSLASSRSRAADTATFVGTQLAEPINVEVGLGVVAIALLALTRHLLASVFLLATVVGESAIYFVTSTLVPRDRPHVPRLGTGDPVASYPSGHSAASLCFYGGVAVLAWRLTSRRGLQVGLTAVAVVLPPLVGFCRMYRGFHHLTDILAGLVLGAVWLTVTTRVLLPTRSARVPT